MTDKDFKILAKLIGAMHGQNVALRSQVDVLQDLIFELLIRTNQEIGKEFIQKFPRLFDEAMKKNDAKKIIDELESSDAVQHFLRTIGGINPESQN